MTGQLAGIDDLAELDSIQRVTQMALVEGVDAGASVVVPEHVVVIAIAAELRTLLNRPGDSLTRA